MPVGMEDDASTVSSMASCSCQDDINAFPIYSIVDLDAFRHDSSVEECFSDEESTNTMPDLVSAEDSSESSSSASGHVPKAKHLSPVKVPEFIEVLPEVQDMPVPPAVLRALYQAKTDMADMQVSAVDYYEYLQVSTVELSPKMPPRGHVDGGALASTTDRKSYLWGYRDFTDEELLATPRLRVADDTVHIPTQPGYLKVPCSDGGQSRFVKTFFTPEIPATILSPDAMGRELGCKGYHTYSDFRKGRATMDLTDCQACDGPTHFDLRLIRGLLFTEHMIAPTPQEHVDPVPDDKYRTTDPTSSASFGSCKECSVNALSREQQRSLWHMRLGHINERAVSDLHKHVDGIPPLPRSDALHSCPIYAQAKLHKANRGHEEPIEATECWQDIQIDYGFFVQRSDGKKKKTKKKASSQTKSKPSTSKTKLAVSKLKAVASRVIRNLNATAPRRRSQRLKEKYRLNTSGDTSVTSATSTSSLDGSLHATPLDDSSVQSKTRPRVSTVEEHDDEFSIASDSFSHTRPTTPIVPTDQEYTFERIVTHEGPLRRGHKKYLGSTFNLKILWSTGATTWEPLDVIFEDAPDAVVEYARRKNLLGNSHWTKVRDYAVQPPPASMADVDDETELGASSVADDDASFTFEGTNLDPDGPAFPGLSPEDAQAKAASAARRFQRLKGINGETCYVLIVDRKSGAWKVSIRRDKHPPIDFIKEWLATHASNAPNRRV